MYMCPMGYDGDMCEINVDDCVDNPCLNNSSCVDGVNSHTCVCSPGYTSETCTVTRDSWVHVWTLSMTPALAHTVAHAWMDSLDHIVRQTWMSVCPVLVLIVLGQLVRMALINMTASVLMDTSDQWELFCWHWWLLAPALSEQWNLLRHGQWI